MSAYGKLSMMHNQKEVTS